MKKEQVHRTCNPHLGSEGLRQRWRNNSTRPGETTQCDCIDLETEEYRALEDKMSSQVAVDKKQEVSL